MVIISRYLTKELLSASFTVTFILLLAFVSQQIVRFLNYAALGKISTAVLPTLVSFEIPYLLAFLLPLGFYLGILLAYGRLYAENEMIILQLAGFGRSKLCQLTLTIASFIVFIVLVLMLWVNPWVSVKQQSLMSNEKGRLHLIQTLIPGRFQSSPDGRYIMFVDKISRDHQRAENIFMAQQKPKLAETAEVNWTIVVANQGYQTKDTDSDDQFFVAENGYRYEGQPGYNDYRITQFNKYAIRLPQNEVKASHQEVEALSSSELLATYANPMHAAEFQWRISSAICTLLFALLAIPLSVVQPRKSRYLALLPAIFLFVIYYYSLIVARHWVEQKVIPITIGVWWVHGIVLLIVLAIFSLTHQHYQRLK